MVNFNGINWRILFVSPNHPELRKKDNTYTHGACVKNNTTIYISNKLNKKKIKRVLYHEFAHAAMFSYNVYMTLEEEEFFANLISLYGYEIISKANNFFSQLYK